MGSRAGSCGSSVVLRLEAIVANDDAALTGERWQANATIVVPGHGPLAGQEVLDAQRRLLEALATEVGELLRAGAIVEEAAVRVRLPAYRELPMAGERLEVAVRGVAIALGSGEAVPAGS